MKQLPTALKLDQEMLLLVDTHKAGNGRLSARVTPVGKPKVSSSLEKSISCSQVHLNSLTGAVGKNFTDSAPKRLYQAHTKDLQDGTQVLSYTFNEPGEYDVQLLFGGQEVPNANARVQVSCCRAKLKQVLAQLSMQLITLRFLYELQLRKQARARSPKVRITAPSFDQP